MAGCSQLLLEKIPDGIPGEESRTYLDVISTSASRMDRLIVDLLEYNGLARSPARLGVVDADLVLSRVLESMAEEIRACSAEIVREGPFPPVLGQQTLLASVLTNLLSNAIKFVAPGAIPRVRLRAEKREGKVRLWVEDNGIGIAPEYHARIFGVFERLNRMEDYLGTGMGLAIVARSVERMGGRVGVDSGNARGSHFWIDLADPQSTPAA
jgi:signal transduction histidine kinase